MDDDVFNGLSYGDNDEWNEETDENNVETVVTTRPPVPPSNSSRISELRDPLNWFHNIPVAAKKKKVEYDSEIITLTTKRIEEAKLRRKAVTSEKSEENRDKEKVSKLLRYPPLRGGEWMGISCPDSNDRRYLTMNVNEVKKNREKLSLQNSNIKRTIHRLLLDYVPKKLTEDHSLQSSTVSTASAGTHKLWIDKYAPKSFFDLLTQDSNNRLTLNWLNLWSEYIFNKPSVYDRLTEAEQQLLEVEDSKPFLPKKKVLIIHGHSGCGKTSLAVLSAKVKYDPFIINMSEIANVADLNKILLHATTYHSLSFDPLSRKPRCLILDGIDYASNDIINALKKYVTNRKKDNALRPIICTCNNVFAPNLRDFRPLCLVLKTTVDPIRFFERMQKICYAENIHIGNLALKNFVDQCQGDIRLCLNNLQFRCPSGKTNNLSKENIDSKNIDTSIFDAIDVVLHLNKHIDKKGFVKNAKERFENIFNLIARRPDIDKFANIIFNNIPEACKPLPKQMLKADKWFIESDILSTYAYSHQDYSLLKYQNASLIGVHFATAVTSSRFMKVSLTVLNVNENRKTVLSMLNTVRFSKANQKHYKSMIRLILDVLPSFLYIIQPPMQISSSLMLQNEGVERINHIASLMASYGLGLKPVIENGAMDYIFDPPLNEIVSYRLLYRHHNLSLPSSAKTYILRQLEMHTAVEGQVTSSTTAPTSKYVPPKPDPWVFRWSSATAQAIKRCIKLQTYMPFLE
uniref:AAA+ ATPase domain-containing protein n=1 Tax=Panagrolaimus sp. PS1159 TaxID=55785 RepID=A0AC35G7J2_9BILA